MTRTYSESESSKIPQAVAPDNDFQFYTWTEVYEKMTAISLADFAEKLQKIEINSVLFHFPRGDFQSWIKALWETKS